MKTAKEIMYDFDNSYGSGLDCEDVEKAMKAYAKQVAEKALEDASENAKIKGWCNLNDDIYFDLDHVSDGGDYDYQIDKQTILNTPIILP